MAVIVPDVVGKTQAVAEAAIYATNVDWVERAGIITASDAAAADYYGEGTVVSANGLVMAVGAPYWEGANTNQGCVYIYDWNGSAWVQRGSVLTPEVVYASDQFGASVSLNTDGSILFVGAANRQHPISSGMVFIFDWSGTAWVQRGSPLSPDDSAASDYFGQSVCSNSSGTTIFVGAVGWEGSTSNQGGVYVFDWDGSAWVQRGSVLTGTGTAVDFGRSCSCSADGTVMIAGESALSSRGGFYTFRWNGSSWDKSSVFLNPNNANDKFGYALSISPSGFTAFIGAYAYNGNRGGVYVFDWSGTAWVQRGSVQTYSGATTASIFGVGVASEVSGRFFIGAIETWSGSITGQGGLIIKDDDGGVDLGTVSTEYSLVTSGLVISQSPAAGESVAAGTDINIVVSLGGAEVPDSTGNTQAEFEVELTAAGLILGTVTTAYSETIPLGQIISQSPAAGTAVDPGSAVDIVVSLGPEFKAVPDVVGQTEANGQALITAGGLTNGNTYEEYSETQADGIITSSRPVAGTLLTPGTAVDIYVSRGPQPVRRLVSSRGGVVTSWNDGEKIVRKH